MAISSAGAAIVVGSVTIYGGKEVTCNQENASKLEKMIKVDLVKKDNLKPQLDSNGNQ